jgi:hypothetical protein
MRIHLLIPFLFLFPAICFSQNEHNSLLLSGGKSWNGTGDFDGFVAEFAYSRKIKERIEFFNGLTTTIHYGKDRGFSGLSGSLPPEETLLFTTAGIQLTSVLNFALINSFDNQLKLGAGPIFRFQSTSLLEQYGYYQDPQYFPEPFYVIYKAGKQNTFSPGYTVGITFQTKVTLKYEAGIKAFFQNDTNGDVITYVSLIFGRVF